MGEHRLGRYELLSLLATGGMGEVYLARSRGLGGFEKLVVIKRSVPSRAHDRDALFAEARLVATLQHTNIVQVYDVEADGPTVFIAMEFLHGQDVRNVLRRAWSGDRRLPLAHAIAIAQAVCAGLAYAHDKHDGDGLPLEIVHRDVSPSNVFVTYDGGVKLIDFGIAKATTLPSETQLGTIKGKPGYMSPEQCRGEPLDRRSDLFCLGIMLYEMTTGERPFRGDTEYMTCRRICEAEPRRPSAHDPQYPAALEAIVMKALAKEPSDRFESAPALQEQLAHLAADLKLDTSQWALHRYMAELFSEELAGWQAAQRTGSLVDYVIRNTTRSLVPRPSNHDGLDTRAEPDHEAARQPATEATVREGSSRPQRGRLALVMSIAMSAGVIATYTITRGSAASEARTATPTTPTPPAQAPPQAAPTVTPQLVAPVEPVRAEPVRAEPVRAEPAGGSESRAASTPPPARSSRATKRRPAARAARASVGASSAHGGASSTSISGRSAPGVETSSTDGGASSANDRTSSTSISGRSAPGVETSPTDGGASSGNDRTSSRGAGTPSIGAGSSSTPTSTPSVPPGPDDPLL